MSFPDSRDALESELASARQGLKQAGDQLRAASEREARLRAELQHRVRNMLAVIRSIFVRTMSAGGPPDDIADHFEGRLDTVTRYQSFHAADDDNGHVDFELIVRDELHSFQFGDAPAISLGGHEARLGHDTAQFAALAIHELITNSIKFGALSGSHERSRLDISWTVEQGELIFKWIESGVAVLGNAPARHGFGREFIEQAIPYQLGGAGLFELRPGGLTCIITLPLDACRAPMI